MGKLRQVAVHRQTGEIPDREDDRCDRGDGQQCAAPHARPTCAKGVMVPVAASRALVVVGMAGTQALPDTMRELQELRRLADIERALVSEVAVDHVDDPSGPRRHHHDQPSKGTASGIEWVTKTTVFPVFFQSSGVLLSRSREISSRRAKRLVHQ